MLVDQMDSEPCLLLCITQRLFVLKLSIINNQNGITLFPLAGCIDFVLPLNQ